MPETEDHLKELQAAVANVTDKLDGVLLRLDSVEAANKKQSPFFSEKTPWGSSSARGLGGGSSNSSGTQGAPGPRTLQHSTLPSNGAESANTLSDSTQQPSASHGGGITGPISHGNAVSLGNQYSSIQDEFNSIKDKVSSVKIPPELRVGNSRTGIKREDTNTANIIANSAKFAETTIKLLWNLEEERADEILFEIFNVQKAHIDYLRQEHSALVVSGQFGTKTSQLFKNLSRGTTNLDDKSLDSLLKAVQITSNENPPAARGRGGGRGGRGYGRGYGGYGYGHYGSGSAGRGGRGWGGPRQDFYNTPQNTSGNYNEGRNNNSE